MAINSYPFGIFLDSQSSLEVNTEATADTEALHSPAQEVDFKTSFTCLLNESPTCAPEVSDIIKLIDKASTDSTLQEEQARVTEILKTQLEEQGEELKNHLKWLHFLFELINSRLLNQYTSVIEAKVTKSAQYFVFWIEIDQIKLSGCGLDALRNAITHLMLARLGLDNNYADCVSTLNEANQEEIATLEDELYHQLIETDPEYFSNICFNA